MRMDHGGCGDERKDEGDADELLAEMEMAEMDAVTATTTSPLTALRLVGAHPARSAVLRPTINENQPLVCSYIPICQTLHAGSSEGITTLNETAHAALMQQCGFSAGNNTAWGPTV